MPIRDTYTDRPATCPICGSPVVTPDRLTALEAEHKAVLSYTRRDADATPVLRDYIDWLKAVYRPGARNKWIALLEAAARVEATAWPDAGEARDG